MTLRDREKDGPEPCGSSGAGTGEPAYRTWKDGINDPPWRCEFCGLGETLMGEDIDHLVCFGILASHGIFVTGAPSP